MGARSPPHPASLRPRLRRPSCGPRQAPVACNDGKPGCPAGGCGAARAQETSEQLELAVGRCPYCELYTIHEVTEKVLVGRSSYHCQTCLGIAH